MGSQEVGFKVSSAYTPYWFPHTQATKPIDPACFVSLMGGGPKKTSFFFCFFVGAGLGFSVEFFPHSQAIRTLHDRLSPFLKFEPMPVCVFERLRGFDDKKGGREGDLWLYFACWFWHLQASPY